MSPSHAFGPDSTADDVVAGLDLSGRRVLVTGASGGLGAETARALASRGAAVTITARDAQKGEGAAAAIRESTGNDAVDVRALDLDKPGSVRAFAEAYGADHDRLDVLINNAGVMACPLARTAEGWEMQFATNHLGHFLLTGLLAPLLVASAPARVVNLSSRGHRFAPVDFDDIHFERRDYDKWISYGQSKTANVLFTVELDRRLRDAGVRAFAVHPGAIMTELGRHLRPEDIAELRARAPGGSGLVFKQVPIGAATETWAAVHPDLDDMGGLYLEDCRVAGMRGSVDAEGGYQSWAVDLSAAARLWEVSEKTLGESFVLSDLRQ